MRGSGGICSAKRRPSGYVMQASAAYHRFCNWQPKLPPSGKRRLIATGFTNQINLDVIVRMLWAPMLI